jgi:hypothetical protein
MSTINQANALLAAQGLATYSELVNATKIILDTLKKVGDLQAYQIKMPDAKGGTMRVIDLEELRTLLYAMNTDLAFLNGGPTDVKLKGDAT